MKYQLGMNLPELLVSLFLTALIISLLTPMYLNNKHLYTETQKQVDEQMDVQWVRALLHDSIRRAGFTPCLNINKLQRVDSRNSKSTVTALSVSNVPKGLIRVNRMSEHFSSIISIASPTQLTVSKGALLRDNHPILIADCNHAEIHEVLHRVQKDKTYVLTLAKPLLFSYDTPAYLGEWLEEHWFIKENRKKINALYYKLSQVDELTAFIRALTVRLNSTQGTVWIELLMELANGETEPLLVAVRGS